MKTKTAITTSELTHLRNRLNTYRQCQVVQSECMFDVAELLGCSADDAMDLLNQSLLAEQILQNHGLEIAPDEPRVVPLPSVDESRSMDSPTILLGCFMFAGVAAVLWLVGRGFDWMWR